MKQYYYSDGIEKYGPFTIEDLTSHDIKGETLVWTEGMDDWKPAREISSISMLFDLSSPPPVSSPQNNPHFYDDRDMEDDRPAPKTYLVEAILVTLFCCLPLGIVGIVYSAKVESTYRTQGYKAARNHSQDAWKWIQIAFWVGIVIRFISLLVVIGGGL